ncbi:thiamine phosphate synthase [Shewanella sp. 10N.286.52.C2]|uniref:thiamine phosphate synthase n=1 Tax=Shewanella sp. 10N.286.52.C2 TaxID=1880838 RepID=UPI000C81D367|nr:thiamine phosphate synthase [Shewanella sp. 10N.286.52.C2]
MNVSQPHSLETMSPIVWTIAGSDSGGGAGIQADLATINDLQCFGCSTITTVTAQNSVAVTLVEAVSESILLAQLNTLASDLAPAAIKIGLIAKQQQLVLIAHWLKAFKSQSLANELIPIILDPVMVASSGDSLNERAKKPLDFSPFKGLISLITPNVRELHTLTDTNSVAFEPQCTIKSQSLDSSDGFYSAAAQLVKQLHCHVLAKGGDAVWQQTKANDLFICRKVHGVSDAHQYQAYWLNSERVNTSNNHGTGCTLSTAIACFLAHNYVLHDAVVMAKAYVLKGLVCSESFGKGAGPVAKTAWPDEIQYYPEITAVSGAEINNLGKTQQELAAGGKFSNGLINTAQGYLDCRFPALHKGIGVYPVVDDVTMLQSVLEANCTTVQLRIKANAVNEVSNDAQQTKLVQDISRAIALGKQYNAQVFINDHWQLAIQLGAFGVHLGQEDLELADLNEISAAGLALGLSSHSVFEILLAQQLNPSYIALGHIFPTTTKVMPSKPQGLAKLARYSALLNNVCPTVAIGGIDASVITDIKATGVDSVAVVRAITEAENPAKAYSLLEQQWHLAAAQQPQQQPQQQPRQSHVKSHKPSVKLQQCEPVS